jgi:hypothetical protein
MWLRQATTTTLVALTVDAIQYMRISAAELNKLRNSTSTRMNVIQIEACFQCTSRSMKLM